jgi:hypothetical protein
LDARGTLNSGGRPFKNISWSLQHFHPFNLDISTASHGMAMALVTSSSHLNVFVPMHEISCPKSIIAQDQGWDTCCDSCWNETFLPAGHYEMNLALSNWIGGSSVLPFSFEKRDEPVPHVQIANGQRIVTDAAQTLFLQGISMPSGCSAGQRPELITSWQVSPPIVIDGRKWNPPAGPTVVFSPFTLPSGKKFTFTFKVIEGASAASLSVDVHVDPAPPLARLSGGDRLISLADTAPLTYTLDAATSESQQRRPGALTFYWTCYQNQKMKDAVIGLQKFDCSLIASKPTYQGSDHLVLDTEKVRKHAFTFSPALKIPSFSTGCDVPSVYYRCDPTVTYTFFVAVCDADVDSCTDNNRLSASTSVVWSTSRLQVPEVRIRALKSSRISAEFNTVCEGRPVEGRPVEGGKPRFQWVQLGPEGSKLLKDSSNLLTSFSAISLVMKPGLLKGADRCVTRHSLLLNVFV